MIDDRLGFNTTQYLIIKESKSRDFLQIFSFLNKVWLNTVHDDPDMFFFWSIFFLPESQEVHARFPALSLDLFMIKNSKVFLVQLSENG